DMTKSAHPKEGEAAQCAFARGDIKGPVLVVRDCFCADVDPDRACELGYGIAVRGEIGGTVILVVQRAFDRCFEAAEGIHLERCFMPAAGTAAEVDVEDRRGGVAVFGGEGAGEEVRVFEHVRVEGADGASCCAEGREVIRIWRGAAFDAPEDARGG